MTEELNRRDFIKRAAMSSVGAGLALKGIGAAKPVAANDKIGVAVIGTGRMGNENMGAFMKKPEVQIVALCDVYQPNLDSTMAAAGGAAKAYKDYRQILDRKDVDVVIITTPDHWHALPTIQACQAGKDVYVEKPICTVLDEGKRMVEAARKYNRVVQVGTWQRSGLHFQKAAQLVQDGAIGKVSFVRTWNYSNIYPEGIGNPPDSDPPATLDWDLWLGPAPKRPFNTNRFGVGDRWSTFRYFWDYAGGWMTDWGVHLLDIVQMAMKVDGPNTITASGGKYYLRDNSEVPDTLQVTYEYPGFVAVYENRLCNANSMYGHGYGIEFHGTTGTLFVDRSGFQISPEKNDKGGESNEARLTPSQEMKDINDDLGDHVSNFLECLKTRQRPRSDIEIGHRSTSTCLLGNVALRSQERIVWDVSNQQIVQGSATAKQYLSRDYRSPWKLTV